MIKITKKSEEITFRQTETTVVFDVNGKKVRVYVHENSDDQVGSDYDIEGTDLKKLTDLEHEAFGEEDMWNLIKMKDEEKIEVDID